jgi:hypothetical protein
VQVIEHLLDPPAGIHGPRLEARRHARALD